MSSSLTPYSHSAYDYSNLSAPSTVPASSVVIGEVVQVPMSVAQVILDQSEVTDDMRRCLVLQRTVYLFAAIDTLFGLLYSLSGAMYGLFGFFSGLMGMIGARNLRPCYVLVYTGAQLFSTIARVSVPLIMQYDHYISLNTINYIFLGLSGFLGLYLTRFTYMFWKLLRTFSGDQLAALRYKIA